MRFNLGSDLSLYVYNELLAAKPTAATGAYAFKWDYLLESFLSKHPSLDGGLSASQRKQAAIDKTLAANERCEQINCTGYTDQSLSFKCIMARAACICRDLLGAFDVRVFESASFTTGATTSRQKRRGDPFYKYNREVKVDVTHRAFPYAYALISSTPLWAAEGGLHNINIVRGNAITTVPKNAVVDRTIAKEPDLNGLLQNAIGTALRLRLRRVGINLQDQSTNQVLAWIGSADGSLATIDLSAASDSVSYRLVWDLIPPDWFGVLDALRCPSGELPNGQTVNWSMFSSMGNGFTFGLETIIFFALAKAVMEECGVRPVVGTNLAVYGDDIIVPVECADRLMHVLRSVGFLPNQDKTFTSGPFRESCGEHYYNGYNVTPIYVRDPITDVSRMLWLLNQLRRWSYDEDAKVCDPSISKLWYKLRRKYVPSSLLGGYDPSSVTRCVSPPIANPHKLVYETKTRPLKGWRACLRWFQYQPSERDVKYGSIDVDDVLGFSQVLSFTDLAVIKSSGAAITKVLPTSVSVQPVKEEGKEDGQYDSYSLLARHSYYFPQECECHTSLN